MRAVRWSYAVHKIGAFLSQECLLSVCLAWRLSFWSTLACSISIFCYVAAIAIIESFPLGRKSYFLTKNGSHHENCHDICWQHHFRGNIFLSMRFNVYTVKCTNLKFTAWQMLTSKCRIFSSLNRGSSWPFSISPPPALGNHYSDFSTSISVARLESYNWNHTSYSLNNSYKYIMTLLCLASFAQHVFDIGLYSSVVDFC